MYIEHGYGICLFMMYRYVSFERVLRVSTLCTDGSGCESWLHTNMTDGLLSYVRTLATAYRGFGGGRS